MPGSGAVKPSIVMKAPLTYTGARQLDGPPDVEHDGAVALRDRLPEAARARVVEVRHVDETPAEPPGVDAPKPS